MCLLVTTVLGKWPHVRSLNAQRAGLHGPYRDRGSVVLAFEYHALTLPGGMISKVSALDKLSVPLTVVIAVLFLKNEKLISAGIGWASRDRRGGVSGGV